MTPSDRAPSPRWAPWWAYVAPIVALNWLSIAVLPPDATGDAVAVALFAAAAAAVVVAVTALHRSRQT